MIAFYSYERKLFFIDKKTITSIRGSFLESPQTFEITQFDVSNKKKTKKGDLFCFYEK